jgi:uncharacterized membrane protein
MTAAASARIVALDAARGAAIVAMVAFHLIWDLGNFGYIDSELPYSAGVKLFGHAIAIAFLFIVGVSLVVARARGVGWGAFWRRLFMIAGAAALVSLGTYVAFPQAFVFFGILHCIALSSLLAAPLLGHRWPLALVAAVLAALAPLVLSHPFFNPVWLTWIGLSTIEPLTYDYRPLAPWSGAVFAGVAAARFWRERGESPLGARMRPGALSWLGRHALAIYLLHQPALFGVFSGLALLGAAPQDAGVRAFVVACVAQCEQGGAPTAICQTACRCTAEEAARGALPSESASERAEHINELARRCFAKTQ